MTYLYIDFGILSLHNREEVGQFISAVLSRMCDIRTVSRDWAVYGCERRN